jgi:DNA (cytosine-5)-methyltransferase 1
MEAAGWTVVAAIDHDERALETHSANFRGLALNVDMFDSTAVEGLIEKLKPSGIDLVAGGPPCQPFSRAGMAKIRSLVRENRRAEHDDRKDLWRAFLRVVTALKPRAVLMENVPDMAIGDDISVVRQIADRLERAGYLVDYRLLDAWRFGVPQHRKRLFLQARSDGIWPQWPDEGDTKVTVRHAIEDLPRLEGGTGALALTYEPSSVSSFVQRLRDGAPVGVIHDHVTRRVRPDDLEAFKLMTSDTLYSDLPEHLRRYRADIFDDKYKRLDWDEQSRTITAHIAKDGYWYIHPEEHRTLTVREAARIQTFADRFRFSGFRSDAFRQIGNAVPPLLGKAVAQRLASTATSTESTNALASLRERITDWAINHRNTRWWLFPGPKMTPLAALVAAHLEPHLLSPERAEKLMRPFAGATSLERSAVEAINSGGLTSSREHRLAMLVGGLGGRCTLKRIDQTADRVLSGAGWRRFEMLNGEDVLIVGDRVTKSVAKLTGSERQGGLNTDVKLELSRLVGTGPNAALRMAAILAMGEDDADLLRAAAT